MNKNKSSLKNYTITFKENKKYNPATRTISILTGTGEDALLLTYDEFGEDIKIININDDKKSILKLMLNMIKSKKGGSNDK